MENSPSQFRYLFAEFSNPETEQAFRTKFLKLDKRLISIIMGLVILAPIFFAISDAIYFRDSPHFVTLEWLRVGLITLTLGSLIIIPRIQSPTIFDRLIFVWLVTVSAVFLFINYTRPAGFTTYRLSDILVIFTIYIAFQIKPTFRLASALVYTFGSFVVVMTQSVPVEGAQLNAIVFTYTFANVVSLVVCWSMQMNRRAQYSTNEQLKIEIDQKEKIGNELRTSEERYRQVVALSPVAILIHRNGEIVFANPATVELFSANSQDEVLGLQLTDFLLEKDHEKAQKQLQKIEETGDLLLPAKVSWKKLDGETIVVEVTAASIDYEGQPGRLALFRDITERNKLEEQMKTAKETAEEASRAKSQFLATMSHELRTPLNAINGFAELLERKQDGPLNDKQVELVQHINKSGNHLLDLITDLLDVSKIDSSVVVLEIDKVPLESLLTSTSAMVQESIKKKDIELTIASEPLLNANGDVSRCRQIVLNLLTNAVKFTPKGGKITLRAMDYEDGFVLITVNDTGPGVAPEEQQNIFFDFYQADYVRDSALGGSGIGLALSRRLVELHSGEMGMESELGTGSTFWFTLPKWDGQSDESTAPNQAISDNGTMPTNRRILVVEDNETNIMVITKFLHIHDHEVTVARNGQEGVELAQELRPDFILMDMKMPVMDGLEATRLIKSTDELKDIPVVVLSASVDRESVEQCIEAGCDAHLAKPLESAKLFAVLNQFLGENK